MVGGVSSLLLALSWGGNEYAWGSATIIGLFVAGAVLAVLFVLAGGRAPAEPILPLRLFSSATFALANAAGFVLGFAMFGAIIFIPLYLQIVKGASPTAVRPADAADDGGHHRHLDHRGPGDQRGSAGTSGSRSPAP